jgi:uncharacterized protein (DUF1800 family)
MRRSLVAIVVLALAACGGGGGSDTPTQGGGGAPAPAPLSEAEAGRLLTQATFGPTDADIAAVRQAGALAWINAQIAAPLPAVTHEQFVVARNAELGRLTASNFYETWWRQAVTEPDQLRQRTAFALSQIFVISLADNVVDVRGAAAYYDMLHRNAFGNFRTLLEDVTLHPMMGRYLTYLGNQKEDAAGTRTPDENYAREVMQLMTIGLVELNPDGTPRLDASGREIATYSPSDISGLAKVFTGISWYHPSPTNATFLGGSANADRSVRPMIFYPAYHSTSEKSFLGTTIPAGAVPDVAGDLRIALDRLFNHPNVGPFISRRLIQQMVTSNPSASYVARVAAVFANNGAGVRGDMGAVVRAILTDAEARDASFSTSASYGKLREPVLRVTHWARAFGASSQTGSWLVTSTSANTSLAQSPLTSPSVFNFWRPGFVPPGTTELGSRSLLAPEFQAVDEVTTASFANVIHSVVDQGAGSTLPGGSGRDIRTSYASETALAGDPEALADRMNKLLFSGQLSPTLRSRIVAAVSAVTLPSPTGTNQAQIDAARLNRAKTAVFLSMISPEYLVQR